ncbi:MAG: molybdate ABC transporter substrate-binding protein [Pseudomonadota bacterium]
MPFLIAGRLLAAATLALAAGPIAAGEVVVSAAASLGNAFKDIAKLYEAHYPSSKVNLNFAASGVLLQQMAKGAPVDVFASADQETMDAAQQQGLVNGAERHDFARNSLVLIVPSDGKVSLSKLDDLLLPQVLRIAIGNPASVPAGRYSRAALSEAKLWPAVQAKAIYTQNVRQSLDYVARGEVDAGFVYGTDAALMKGKVKLAFTVPLDAPISYPIAPTRDGAHAEEARRFVTYVRSPAAQAILAGYGFMAP